MVDNEFLIKGDRFNGKNLLLNWYFLTNSKSKFNDEDVKNLHLKNINTVNELYNFFKTHTCIADFFICLINDKAKIKKDKKGSEKELFDILVRFKSITFVDDLLDPNLSLTILGDINPEIGVINVKNIFLTAMEKTKQDFETPGEGVVLEIADNFNLNEAKTRTILDSNVMANMKFLISTFQEEKTEWLQYLQFQTQDLEYKRSNSCLYLDSKLMEYVKIPKTVPNFEKYHDAKFSANNFWYVPKNIFIKNNIKLNPNNYEEIIIANLTLFVADQEKYRCLKSLQNLSVAPLNLNRSYKKDNPLTLMEFSYNDSFAQDSNDIIDLGFNINTTQHINDSLTPALILEKLWNIYLNENNIDKPNGEQQEISQLLKTHLKDYQPINAYYELQNEEELSLPELNNQFPQYGYLTYVGKGDSTLIRRSSVILEKISKNDVANPYLINYIFNIEDVKIKNQNHLLTINDLTFASNNLNEEQKLAIVKTLNSQDIFLLQGPPGTGKTEFIAELVYQYAMLGKKILVSSQNHTAIDNVLMRLYKTPQIAPLRLTGEEVRKKNKFTDFNPDKLIFNHYRFIYTHLLQKYLAKWNALDYDYENQKLELQKLKTNAKMLTQEIAEAEKLKVKLAELTKLRDDIINNELITKNKNKKLIIEINNINNIFEMLNDYNWSGVINPNSEVGELFKKHFGVIIQEKLGTEFDSSFSIQSTYQKIIQTTNSNNKLITIKEQELFELKNINKENRDDDWLVKFTTVYQELNDLKAVDHKQEVDITQYEYAISAFQNDLEMLKVIYENRLHNLQESNNGTTIAQYDQEISYLADEVKVLDQKVVGLKIEIENLVQSINNIFNMQLTIKDIAATISDIDQAINEIDLNIKNIVNEKNQKNNFVNNLINFLDNNYRIGEFLDQENINSNKFTSFMERDTVSYANQFLQNNVNVVAMTATANQSYAQSKNKVLQDYNISDIDIKKFAFDVVIIDEVSKLTPMEVFMPLVYGKAVVLVGDYRQLPPIMPYREEDIAKINTVYQEHYSYHDFNELLTNSMFKKLVAKCDDSVKGILTKQYRSHEDIMRVVNVFYENQLQLGDSENQNNLKQHYIKVNNKKGLTIFEPRKAVYWIDSTKDATNTNIVYEQGESGSTSLFNWLEIELTVKTLLLIEEGYNNQEIKLAKKPKVAVISFYGLHVKKLRRAISNLKFKNIIVEVSTVDDYQGRETEIVIVNTVRNPKNQEKANKEFIKKYERLNVAFSRAKNMLVIIGAINFFAHIEVEIPTIANPEITKMVKAYYEIIKIIDEYGTVFNANDILD
ncbi:AAA domain-containing protein [Spiroplasma eriocheiris]|uniref:Superfamily I DNA/RNA helicase n=1 Tax=Spiroplasma eriocheiris TaxID=315358 RepID=A0A0H3XMA0_9MOLU|nr:AAA domain-containing protein [Spiroplasma eriocheiris]AHF58289.1 putative helicase [Spiroplasma eriocheiris CCTCC M 207170]AKM54724.1 superfamily I DNA/RNA helicase [Spiroplasma eriocheiris]